MLVMPQPASSVVPAAVWEKAETKEMEETVTWYGKVWQTWDLQKSSEVPLGSPELMVSFTKETEGMRKAVKERDEKMFGKEVWREKARVREHIPWYETDKEADAWEQDLLP